MDILKFIILTIACIGGFMATSYSSVALRKGWRVGTFFETERMSFLLIAGFICQYGSVIISFFVNPWWSALLVFGLGFVGNMILTSIFKMHSQILATFLIIASYILVPIFVY